MENMSKEGKQAPKQASPDWYDFNQNGPASRGADQQKPKPPGAGDPYDYHQGPHKPGDSTHQPKPGDGKHHKPGGQKNHLTLYDVAEGNLKSSGTKISNQDQIYFHLNDMMVAHGFQKANLEGRTNINDHMLPKSWNDVNPHKLQEKAPDQPAPKPEPPKGDQPAPKPEPPKGDQPAPKPEPPKGDHPAPKPGDGKTGDQKPGDNTPKSPEEKARAEFQKKVEADIAEKYSLPPIEKGKGYYDAVANAHPDWKPKQVMDEAKRVRHLNSDRTDLKVGERVSTISKEERAAMIAKAMEEYDKPKQNPG